MLISNNKYWRMSDSFDFLIWRGFADPSPHKIRVFRGPDIIFQHRLNTAHSNR